MRLTILLALVLSAGACADPADADQAAAPTGAAAPAESTSPRVEPPPMAVEPPPRRMPGSEPLPQRCDVAPAQRFIGREATEAVVQQARQAAGAEVVRTLRPDQMVTREYHLSRLTLYVDDANVITDVRCG